MSPILATPVRHLTPCPEYDVVIYEQGKYGRPMTVLRTGEARALYHEIGRALDEIYDDSDGAAISSRIESDESLLARLFCISEIIEQVGNRCMAVDGPVSKILDEMTQEEVDEIYRLANVEGESC